MKLHSVKKNKVCRKGYRKITKVYLQKCKLKKKKKTVKRSRKKSYTLEAYINKWSRKLQKWDVEIRLTTTDYGCYSPVISSYLDDMFISYTFKDDNNNSSIKVLKYNSISSNISVSVTVSDDSIDTPVKPSYSESILSPTREFCNIFLSDDVIPCLLDMNTTLDSSS